MRQFICTLLLYRVAYGLVFSKLSTLGQTELVRGDYISSCLGFYRMSLLPDACQLQVQAFNTSYVYQSVFPSYPLGVSCNKLILTSTALITDTNVILLQLAKPNAPNSQTIFLIDQLGNLYLIGTIPSQYLTVKGGIYITPLTESRMELNADQNFKRKTYINNGNWAVNISKGLFTLFNIEDPTKYEIYNFTKFTLNESGVSDLNGNLPPNSTLKLNYARKCQGSLPHGTFRGPWTMILHAYWPQFRVVDRTGFEVFSLIYPRMSCISDLGINVLYNTNDCIDWFCPPKTFELNGKCETKCPRPYYSFINPSGKNRCLLLCPEGAILNNVSMVCTCGQYRSETCLAGLIAVPMGCLCKNSTYFQSDNLFISENINIAQVCFGGCGPGYFQHSDGMCVKCPTHCAKCTLNGTYAYAYLTCVRCKNSYELINGICGRTCVDFAGKYKTDQGCTLCQLPNCQHCSANQSCCQCLPPYLLLNNNCIQSIPAGHKLNYNRTSSRLQVSVVPDCSTFPDTANLQLTSCPGCPKTSQFSCLQNCIPNVFLSSYSSCYCLAGSVDSFANSCGSAKPNDCDFMGQYFDSLAKECLNCPLPCLTCTANYRNEIQCTSCKPTYELFASGTENMYCQTASYFSVCTLSYDINRQLCTFKDNDWIDPSRSACLAKVPNCKLCLYGISYLCSLCASGYYLVKDGTCVANCPVKSYKYEFQPVCVNRVINDCLKEKIGNMNYLIQLTWPTQTSVGYQYYLSSNFKTVNILNDPIGIVFWNYPKTSNAFPSERMTTISSSLSQCSVCNPGFGFVKKRFCAPCNPSCKTCIKSKSKYCTSCPEYHYLTAANACVKNPPEGYPCQLLFSYRNESGICQQTCNLFYTNIIDTVFPRNCTLSCPIGSITQKTLNNAVIIECNPQQTALFQSAITFVISRMSFNRGFIYILASNFPFDDYPIETIQILQNQNNQNMMVLIPTNHYMVIVSQNSDQGQVLVLQFAVQNVQARDKDNRIVYLGNSLYSIGPETSLSAVLQATPVTLVIYGRILTLVMVIIAFGFAILKVNYKIDNLCILMTSCYLLLPTSNLVADSAAIQLYSLLFGMSWTAFMDPQLAVNNIFSSNIAAFLLPNGYAEIGHSTGGSLLSIDNNLVRNCWHLFVIDGLAILLWFVTSIIHQKANQRKQSFSQRDKCCSQKVYSAISIDYLKSISYMSILVIQNSIMPLIVFSICTLNSKEWALASDEQIRVFHIVSIVTIVVIVIYFLLRLYVNRIAGLCCLKRIIISSIFGVAAILGGIDNHRIIFGGSLALLEAAIVLLRFKLQKTQLILNESTESGTRYNVFKMAMLFSEEFINITFFVLLTVADKIPEAAAIIILAAIGIMMSSLAVELGIALENRGYQKTSVRVTRLLVQSQEPDNQVLSIRPKLTKTIIEQIPVNS